MRFFHTDVLCIGAGLAGERVAIEAAKAGFNVICLSIVPPRRSHSCCAQGGMQAALGNSIMGDGDSPEIHFNDTVKGSDWGCDQEVARIFAKTAPIAMREMAFLGCPWNRVVPGEHTYFKGGKPFQATEKAENEGLIHSRAFGGTAKWRTCYTSDGTGHEVLYTLDNRAIQLGVTVHDRMQAEALIHDGDQCMGCVARDLRTGELVGYFAKATLIATGGYGRIYRATTNSVICDGGGHIIALDTGIVPLGNMEAVQFHPTGTVPTDILVTEGCRGDGGTLLDKNEYRFMPDYEPEKAELASRDVVSRRMTEHMRKGFGVKSPYGEHLWLDIRHLGEKHIKTNLREVYDICTCFLGVDPVTQLIPVRPTQHYSMGGIRTNKDGAVYGMKGLFSNGESACWDMHGFNRLGGNSVAETVVAGMIVGEFIADFCEKPENGIDIPTSIIYESLAKVQNELNGFIKCTGNEDAVKLRTRMQEVMTTKIGIFRRGKDMEEAVTELEELYKRSFNIPVKDVVGNNPELVYAYRTRSMLRVALTVAYGALNRQESRGAHYREDFSVRDDVKWLNRTIATWKDGDTLPTLSYQPLDISKMELPPGFRGYGVKNYIENPESAKRQAEVDAIRQKMEAEGKDRWAIQDAIMPYQHLLPKRLLGRNERIDEPLND